MKRTAFRVMILAAAAVAAVTTASAQSMRAEIPFAFQAVGVHMPAGSYWVTLDKSGSGAILRLYNPDGRKSILTMPRVSHSPAKPEPANPVLSFAVTDGRYVLSSLKNDESTVYSFNGGKAGPGTQMATIALRTDRAE